MRTPRLLLLSASALLLAACASPAVAPSATPAPTATPVSAPIGAAAAPRVQTERVRVQPVYEDMLPFVERVRADPKADRWEAFQDEVVFPNRFFLVDYFQGSPQRQAAWRQWIESVDLAAIEDAVALIRRADLERLLAAAVVEVNSRLPLPSLDIFILLAPPAVEAGLTLGPSKFGLFLTDFREYLGAQKTPEEVIAFWQRWSPFILAHEAHHSVRLSRGAGGSTLADFLVQEGLADAFAQEVYPEPVSLCDNFLTPRQERLIWAEMQPLLSFGGDALYQRYFQGDSGLNPCVGYDVGYSIVRSYLKNHPGVTAADLVAKPSHEILLESGYNP